MNDLDELFRRQAEWQREQANLPWTEKLRLSVIMREALIALRRSRHDDGSSHDSDEQSKHPNR
jgi:hypothetical protein